MTEQINDECRNLNLTSAISSMIGYCESLKAGTVITEGYADRMKDYYVPKLQEAIMELKIPQADKPAKIVDDTISNETKLLLEKFYEVVDWSLINHLQGYEREDVELGLVAKGIEAVVANIKPAKAWKRYDLVGMVTPYVDNYNMHDDDPREYGDAIITALADAGVIKVEG
jgi:hypothetical protein